MGGSYLCKSSCEKIAGELASPTRFLNTMPSVTTPFGAEFFSTSYSDGAKATRPISFTVPLTLQRNGALFHVIQNGCEKLGTDGTCGRSDCMSKSDSCFLRPIPQTPPVEF